MSEAPKTNVAALGDAAKRAQRLTRLVIGLALLPTVAAILLATLGPVTSGDLWWHLRTGEWILTEGQLPTTDPFSHTAGDTPWILQEYGSQVLFALTHRLAGFAGLGMLGAVLSLATLFVAFRRTRLELRTPWAAALVAVFALLFALKWELRPHLVSILFFFWLEANLFGRGSGGGARGIQTPTKRRMLELFLISMVWVQLHAEALFAPLLVLAVCSGAAIAAVREGAGTRHLLAWLGMFTAALAGTLASPLFAEPHIYALVGRGVPQQYIEEWFRPWVLPGDARFAPVTVGIFVTYAIALAVGGAFALRSLLKRIRLPGGSAPLAEGGQRLERVVTWERLAFLAGCLLFALSARRFFWLTWFPLFDAVALFVATRPDLRAAVRTPALVTAVCGLVLATTHYPARAGESLARGRFTALVDPALFPAHAVNFAAEAGLIGNLYHPYEWGGYIGYVTEQPVFIDGRTVLFEEIIPERQVIEWNAEHRGRLLDERDVEVVIFKHWVDHGAGVVPWSPGPGWVKVWTDQLARVFVRRGSRNQIAAAGWWRTQGVELDPKDGIREVDIDHARPDWILDLDVLPAEVVDALDAAVAGALEDAKRRRAEGEHMGSDFEESTLARMRFWRDRRMRKNLRAELEHLLRTERALSFGGYVDPDEVFQHYRELLDASDPKALDGIVEELELMRQLAPSS